MEKEKLAIIIPVAPSEPKEVVKRSVDAMLSLDLSKFDYKIVYSIDVVDENEDERVKLLKKYRKHNIVLLARKPRGRRAGAINDAVEFLSSFNPEYVAIFDVDSVPEREMISKCIDRLRRRKDVFLVSCPRKILNSSQNSITRNVSLEYRLYELFLRHSGFKMFNGLIGVLRYDILKKEKLNENVLGEDDEFITRMYLKGYEADVVTDCYIYEEAVSSVKDLLKQRVRWYYSSLENFFLKVKAILKTDKLRFKISRVLMPLSLFPVFLLPLALLLLLVLSKGLERVKALFLSLFFSLHVLLLQIAAVKALWNFFFGRKVEWVVPKRNV
jgi:cellulose synthase/poly-beta-1,6-N-acetylglucosamine synthase-like glycosyltransferase